MIICCFDSIGKKVIAKSIPGYTYVSGDQFESEDSYFSYLENNCSEKILTGYSINLRKFLFKNNIPFVTILPRQNLKDEYIERYKNFRKKKSDIDYMADNWNSITRKVSNEEPVIYLNSGEFLFDIIWKLDALHYYSLTKESNSTKNKKKSFSKKTECVVSSSFAAFTPEKIVSIIDNSGIAKDLDEIGMEELGDQIKENFNIDLESI